MSPRGWGRPAPGQRCGRPAAPGRPAPRPPGQPPAPLPRAPGWTQSLCADPLPVRFWGSFKQLNNPKTGDSRGRLCQQAEEAPASRTPPSEMAPPPARIHPLVLLCFQEFGYFAPLKYLTQQISLNKVPGKSTQQCNSEAPLE